MVLPWDQTVFATFVITEVLIGKFLKIKDISFNIHIYESNGDLMQYLENNSHPGKIYFGPISADDSLGLNKYCDDGVLFFARHL